MLISYNYNYKNKSSIFLKLYFIMCFGNKTKLPAEWVVYYSITSLVLHISYLRFKQYFFLYVILKDSLKIF